MIDPAEDQLCQVVHRGEETRDLDYKQAAAWDEKDKKACVELVKDILAMANTLGGYIVVGVAERSGVLEWQGLTADQLKSWDSTRIGNFVNTYADPPITVSVRKVSCRGKWYVVLGVPRFPGTPHISQKDFPGVLNVPVIYVRTDSAESAPVRRSAEYRVVIEQAVRNQQDQMLEAMRSILTGARLPTAPADRDQFGQQAAIDIAEADAANPFLARGLKGNLVSVMFPAQYQPDRFSIDQLREGVQAASGRYRGWPFLFVDYQNARTRIVDDGIQTAFPYDDRGGFPSFDFWRLRQSGLLVHEILLREDAMESVQPGAGVILDWVSLTLYSAEAIDTLAKLYSALDLSGEEITWRLAVRGASGRKIGSHDSFRNFWLHGTYVSTLDQIIHEESHPLEEWKAGLEDHVVRAVRSVLQRFQWLDPDQAMIRDWTRRLFERRL